MPWLSIFRLISAANAQMLFHYWKIDNYILYYQNRQGWGGKVIKKLAQAIRFNYYPEKKGYSVRNLTYMCQFARYYLLQVCKNHGQNPKSKQCVIYARTSCTNSRCSPNNITTVYRMPIEDMKKLFMASPVARSIGQAMWLCSTTRFPRLNTLLEKAFKWFPMFREMLRMEKLCAAIGFTKEMIESLLTKKEAIRCNGRIYSEEHRRKFDIKNDIFKVEKNPTDGNKLVLTINRQPIGEWFKEQFDKLQYSFRKPVKSRQNKGLKL